MCTYRWIRLLEQVGRGKAKEPAILRIEACDSYSAGIPFYRGDDLMLFASRSPPPGGRTGVQSIGDCPEYRSRALNLAWTVAPCFVAHRTGWFFADVRSAIYRSRSNVIVPTALSPTRTALTISGVRRINLSPSIVEKRV